MAIPRSISQAPSNPRPTAAQNRPAAPAPQSADFSLPSFESAPKATTTVQGFYQSSVDDATKFCCSLLSTSVDRASVKQHPESGYIIVQTDKGRFFYNEDGSFLYAAPHVTVEQQETAYKAGTRTPYNGETLPLERGFNPLSSDSTPDIEQGWGYDPKTGKKYKLLVPNTSTKEINSLGKKTQGGSTLGIADLRRIWGENSEFKESEAFYGNGLNDLSDTFLAHLKVPPNQEEMAELRRKKAQMVQSQEAEWAKNFESNPEDY